MVTLVRLGRDYFEKLRENQQVEEDDEEDDEGSDTDQGKVEPEIQHAEGGAQASAAVAIGTHALQLSSTGKETLSSWVDMILTTDDVINIP